MANSIRERTQTFLRKMDPPEGWEEPEQRDP